MEELDRRKNTTEAVSKQVELKEADLKENEAVAPTKNVQPTVRPPPPFPQNLKKQMEYACFGKFLSLLKQVHINLPWVDVLQGIPRYAKYVKKIVANKIRLIEYETVAVIEDCRFRIKNQLPIKLKDLGNLLCTL